MKHLFYGLIFIILLTSCQNEIIDDMRSAIWNIEIENKSNYDLQCSLLGLSFHYPGTYEEDFISWDISETQNESVPKFISSNDTGILSFVLYTSSDGTAKEITSFKVNIIQESNEINIIGLPEQYLTHSYNEYSLGYIDSAQSGIYIDSNTNPVYSFIYYKMIVEENGVYSITLDEEKSTLIE